MPARSVRRAGTESSPTLCWREMDSSFQYASTVRWHRATHLPLPPTVKQRSAGRPPAMARPRSEAQRGSVRSAARHAVHPSRNAVLARKGHEDQFQSPRLSGGCRFGQGTFAEIYRSGREAPVTAIGARAMAAKSNPRVSREQNPPPS
jgi:hypothetical protein